MEKAYTLRRSEHVATNLEEKLEQLEGVKLMNQLALNYGFKGQSQPTFSNKERAEEFTNSLKQKRKFPFASSSGQHQSQSEFTKKVRFEARHPHPAVKTGGNSSGVSTSSSSANTDRGKKPQCWGCSGEHVLAECPVVRDELQRTKIVDQKKKTFKKNTPPSKQYFIDDVINCRAAHENKSASNCVIKLNGVECEVLLDNGSDRSLISETWLKEFEKNYGQKVHIYELEKTVSIATVDPSKTIETSSYALMSMTFRVYQDLRLRERTFFIVKQDI
jgi:hypothetical protein